MCSGRPTTTQQAVATRKRERAVEHILFEVIEHIEAKHPGLLDAIESSLDHPGDPADDETKDDEAVRDIVPKMGRSARDRRQARRRARPAPRPAGLSWPPSTGRWPRPHPAGGRRVAGGLPDRLGGPRLRQAGPRPGRGGLSVQSTPAWSTAHLEEECDTVTLALLAALSQALATPLPTPTIATAHRWRYARADARTDGALWNAAARIGACGDWLLGPRVESAWLSGRRMGEWLVRVDSNKKLPL